MKLYKVLNEDGTPYHGGTGQWSLPTEDGPGDWMPAIEGELIACKNGYHLCRERDLLRWLGPAIFEAEARGDCLEAGGKVVVRESRLVRRLNWDARIARLFACDCAEDVLHLFERAYPDDKRPRQAIETARRYANGEVTDEDLAASSASAWDAAWDSLWDASMDAWNASRNASRNAARAAAKVTAWNASRAAWDAWEASVDAWNASRDAQTKRLMEYLEGCRD